MAQGNNEMSKAIGGYFEIADRDADGVFPIDGIRLNTCRNALEYVIRCLPDVKHIYLPLYTCESVIEPIVRLQIPYSFYHINEQLEIADDIQLCEGEYLIANNYFGLKDAYISRIAQLYGERLIVDNAQALFAPVIDGVKAVYSPRKFVGVADGGFAVGVGAFDVQTYEQDDSSLHDSHLLIRKEQGAEAGFGAFRTNERLLDNQPIKRMSQQTEDILTHIDYKSVIARRLENFEYLQTALKDLNELRLPDIGSFSCPMVYPFLTENDSLRDALVGNKVFVARYWPNVLEWAKPSDIEYKLAKSIIPLPIDQRYGRDEMDRIINSVLKNFR